MWPFLDGELDAAEDALVASHLERCPACARAFESGRAFLEGVALAGNEEAPAGLRERVESILDSGAASDRPASAGARPAAWRRAWKVALPLAAAVAALLLFRPGAGPGPDGAWAARGFAADHAAHAVALPSERPFEAGEERPAGPPRLEDGRLVGLSRCIVEGRVYAHYVFDVGGATVSTFVPVRGAIPGETGARESVDGTTVVTVEAGAGGVVLVSEEHSPEALAELVPGA